MRQDKSTTNTSLAQDIKVATTQGTVVSTEEPLHMVTGATTTRRPGTATEGPHTHNMEVITSTRKVVASIATSSNASTSKKRTPRGSSNPIPLTTMVHLKSSQLNQTLLA